MTTIYVDSRLSASGSDSDFTITLRETVHIQQGARLRVDKIRFIDSFFSTDLGRYIYYADGSGGLSYYALPEQAYTGTRLAADLQAVTGRTTTYSEQANAITQVIVAGQEWLDDATLRAYTGDEFRWGSTAKAPLTINQVFGPGSAESTTSFVCNFVKMSPYDTSFSEVVGSPLKIRTLRIVGTK